MAETRDTKDLERRLRAFNTPDRVIDYQRPAAEAIHEAADAIAEQRKRIAELEAFTLKAQEHAIECGNRSLDLYSALAMLKNACDEAKWPLTADQMTPMNMARAALGAKK